MKSLVQFVKENLQQNSLPNESFKDIIKMYLEDIGYPLKRGKSFENFFKKHGFNKSLDYVDITDADNLYNQEGLEIFQMEDLEDFDMAHDLLKEVFKKFNFVEKDSVVDQFVFDDDGDLEKEAIWEVSARYYTSDFGEVIIFATIPDEEIGQKIHQMWSNYGVCFKEKQK